MQKPLEREGKAQCMSLAASTEVPTSYSTHHHRSKDQEHALLSREQGGKCSPAAQRQGERGKTVDNDA